MAPCHTHSLAHATSAPAFAAWQFSSNLFRTAYELHAARCECAAPFVSLDAPWCFDHGTRAGANWEFPTRKGGVVQPNTFGC